MEDRGEDAEFIPITVLSSDQNVVRGGPRRHMDVTGLTEEGTQGDERKQWVSSVTHDSFNIHNRQELTMYMSKGSLAEPNPLQSKIRPPVRLEEQSAFWH